MDSSSMGTLDLSKQGANIDDWARNTTGIPVVEVDCDQGLMPSATETNGGGDRRVVVVGASNVGVNPIVLVNKSHNNRDFSMMSHVGIDNSHSNMGPHLPAHMSINNSHNNRDSHILLHVGIDNSHSNMGLHLPAHMGINNSHNNRDSHILPHVGIDKSHINMGSHLPAHVDINKPHNNGDSHLPAVTSNMLVVIDTKCRRTQFGLSDGPREIFWRQRSKQLWLQARDSNSQFFHKSTSSRRRNKLIAKLKDSNGIWHDWDTVKS
ncbi:hypothetical protein G4B88_031008 [Cannabis sativa]|uniref:Uncharacterized protein n=1 Tax=Cannabis sativa TaxID=3483 RepID=A0A7J6DMT7_CANSA|nr:hypothetical protein G4B88_031008 [Cannabis sativa]